MNPLKISVVTISFNQANYIRACIDSVLSQKGIDVEYIVVDAGSTDGSRDIISGYAGQLRTLFESDDGPADGLNKGFLHTSGDILFFLNSDDIVFPGSFLIALEFFQKNPDADMLLTAGVEMDGSGVCVREFYPSKATERSYVNGAVTLFQQGMYFRRRVFDTVKFNPLNRTCWDGEFFFDALMSGFVVRRLMVKTAAFRIYPASITGSQRFHDKYKADQLIMYRRIYGRNSNVKTWISIYYRFAKIAFDPKYLFFKIKSEMKRSLGML
jgi:glycosyltransferase involved in cell wall biosynthesis